MPEVPDVGATETEAGEGVRGHVVDEERGHSPAPSSRRESLAHRSGAPQSGRK